MVLEEEKEVEEENLIDNQDDWDDWWKAALANENKAEESSKGRRFGF